MSWKKDKERGGQPERDRDNVARPDKSKDKPQENPDKRTPLELYRESGFDSGFVFHEE